MDDAALLIQLRSFNSIKVRLKQAYLHVRIEEIEFQFHKGAIKTVDRHEIALDKCRFNSIKVRLKLDDAGKTFYEYCRFNSIKVRLKPSEESPLEKFIRFQFHKGAIKTYLPRYWYYKTKCFNSIKVRLKL